MSILFPNESFHSLLLRYYLREANYTKILKGVISARGYWRNPSHLDIPDFISNLPDEQRFELVKETLIVNDNIYRKDTDLFIFNVIGGHYQGANPLCFSDMRIFRNGYLNFSINRNIYYCYHCIINSIEAFGVGYFKKEWITEGNHYCKEHKVILNKLTIEKGESAIDKIIQTLSGKIPPPEKNIDISTPSKKNNSLLKEYLPISTHCLWNETISFIQYFIINTFKQYELQNINNEYKRAFKTISTPKGQLKFLKYSDEVSLIKFMVNNFYIELGNLIYNNARLVTSDRVMHDGSRIKYCSFKLVQAKCDSCIEEPSECLNSLKVDFDMDEERDIRLIKKGHLRLLNKRKYKLANNDEPKMY
ncbi:hypothetical protein PSECIP111854_04096 [Pseudoalteromonas sp. CIP111854]|uniref:Uncharacterized protein n=1 Tax=Pseudoalteromonas holothuriae TaxID=2963714 RepID=A0A9W4R554_9GAMM|nr:hypothetical protein [Pseudoalteromonas sp. CIP111854]CAH9067398.1 hypothetical protein PSECIP111854_04096 [Pseudoalteromonas sp. CIP111854]